MSKPTAIITDVRYRMSLAIIRDLAEAGVRIVAVERDKTAKPLGAFSRYVERAVVFNFEKDEQPPTPRDARALSEGDGIYLDELYRLCEEERDSSGQKPALIPVGAGTLKLLAGYEVQRRFSEVSCMLIPNDRQLELLNDKERLHGLAELLDIPVPNEYKKPFDGAVFPCIVKPLCGESYGLKASERYVIAESAEELQLAVARFRMLCNDEFPVVQQYIKGEGYGCSVVARDGKILSSVSHHRIREQEPSGGPSTCCESLFVPEIYDYAERIVKKLNLSGVCMFEFKRSEDGIYYLLEANPRVWGSYPLTRCSNSNFSLVWFKAAESLGNRDFEFELPVREERFVRMHFALSDLIAGRKYMAEGLAGKGLGAFWDTVNPAVKSGLFEWGDQRPAWEYFKAGLKRLH